MPTLKLSLDKRRLKNDRTYPLVFRISANGESRSIPIGHSIKEEYWNSKTDSIKKSLPEYNALISRIQALYLKFYSKMLEFEKSDPNLLSAALLKEYILAAPKPKMDVYSFWEQEIELLHKSDRSGGARTYMESLAAINKAKDLHIPFESINHTFLKNLEAELISRGVSINGIGFYYRTLRAVYNKAIYAKEVSLENYPFRTYKIRKEPTRPRVLTREEMSNFFNADIEKSSLVYESWLLGKLMFMLIGINFKDLILMKESQIQHGRLIYTRAKTKRQYSIKLLPEALGIIDYFRGRSELTIIGKLTPAQLENKMDLPLIIKQANKVFNAHLMKIGKQIECKEKLTGYCMRYSTANIAKQLGYSKDLISEALGHSMGLRVTGIYLENFDLEIIDNMNQHICKTVMKPVIKDVCQV